MEFNAKAMFAMAPRDPYHNMTEFGGLCTQLQTSASAQE